MNSAIQAAINSAMNSLQDPEPVTVTKAGAMQIERTGKGDVQELMVGKQRKLDATKLDGNITLDAFDKLWQA